MTIPVVLPVGPRPHTGLRCLQPANIRLLPRLAQGDRGVRLTQGNYHRGVRLTQGNLEQSVVFSQSSLVSMAGLLRN